MRSSSFTHMADGSATVPTPVRCLHETGLFLIVLHFLSDDTHKLYSGVQDWVEVTSLVAFQFLFYFPKTDQGGAVSQ